MELKLFVKVCSQTFNDPATLVESLHAKFQGWIETLTANFQGYLESFTLNFHTYNLFKFKIESTLKVCMQTFKGGLKL